MILGSAFGPGNKARHLISKLLHLHFIALPWTSRNTFPLNKKDAMGSPLGPLMANSFMCRLEAQLCSNQQVPKFYRRYMDDAVATFNAVTECDAFLQTLNSLHPSARFIMEPAKDEVLPFIGVNLHKQNCNISTYVHRKASNTGLLLHHHSHVDNRYKSSLLRTMLLRAYRVCSSWSAFH